MERWIELDDDHIAMQVFGVHDRNIKLLRDHLKVAINARGHTIHVRGEGEQVDRAAELLEAMVAGVREGQVADDILDAAIDAAGPADPNYEGGPALDKVAKTEGQLEYLQAIHRSPVVFGIGPAGTGKTYLAVRMAVEALKEGSVHKLVLCRPAVEAGEKLGFLPGDFQAKVNPYLRPLYDALNELLDYDQVRRYSDREIIEIVPLAYMRGRTLNRSFIILDEAQNTTRAQMKMFLTRMGADSRIVVTGDITQVDLPQGQLSGLLHARRILSGIDGIDWVELTTRDIVRHPLVTRIINAYERHEGGGSESGSRAKRGRNPIKPKS